MERYLLLFKAESDEKMIQELKLLFDSIDNAIQSRGTNEEIQQVLAVILKQFPCLHHDAVEKILHEITRENVREKKDKLFILVTSTTIRPGKTNIPIINEYRALFGLPDIAETPSEVKKHQSLFQKLIERIQK